MITIKIEGLEELHKRLNPTRFAEASKIAIGKAATEVVIAAKPYPTEGPWNQPGPYPKRWYQRMYGARWARKDGSVGGSQTSEKMQQKWVTQVVDSFTAIVRNLASYAPWVKGKEQAGFHADHGWTKLQDDADGLVRDGTIVGIFKTEVEKMLRGK